MSLLSLMSSTGLLKHPMYFPESTHHPKVAVGRSLSLEREPGGQKGARPISEKSHSEMGFQNSLDGLGPSHGSCQRHSLWGQDALEVLWEDWEGVGKHGEVMGSPTPRELPQAVGEPDRMAETQLEEQQCGK